MHLKSNVVYLRRKSGLSLRVLATNIDVAFSTVRQIEIGSCLNPRIDTVDKLAKYFWVSIDVLVHVELNGCWVMIR